jgi:oligopeptide transport system permease protein
VTPGLVGYLGRRLAQAVVVLIGATLVIYGAAFLLPGNPIAALSGDQPLPPGTVHDLQLKYHLDEPFLQQYGHYLAGILHGDFGTSIATGQRVSSLIAQAWPVTLRLALTAWAIEIVVGLGWGIVAALRRGGLFDRVMLVATIVAVAVPVFVIAFIAQLLLGIKLHWLPVAGLNQGWPRSYLLPAAALAAAGVATVGRLARATLLETLGQEYVRMAVAKGLPRRWVIGKHALRGAIIPVITYLGVDLGFLLGGAVAIEGIFNLPGVGLLIYNAIEQKDGAVVVGVATLLVLVFLVGNLLVDLLYAVVDPRIRYR